MDGGAAHQERRVGRTPRPPPSVCRAALQGPLPFPEDIFTSFIALALQFLYVALYFTFSHLKAFLLYRGQKKIKLSFLLFSFFINFNHLNNSPQPWDQLRHELQEASTCSFLLIFYLQMYTKHFFSLPLALFTSTNELCIFIFLF